ncbi:MAG: hypothetical protein QGH60_07085 [Phycisphaerae bacterium]|jgi:hypothetical protein|nr:hypothetical protein [Phycisphaerae bacterium]
MLPINKTNLMILTSALLAVSICPQLGAATDLCSGAIDPYDIVSEKGRFYLAAGRDNELTAEEFGAIKTGSGGFRRSFDKWSDMLKFDKDANKSLDWVEAVEYRYEMRKLSLAAYDANRDGRLTGSERANTCKALASGRIRPADRRTAHLPPPPPPKKHPDKHKSSSHKPDRHHGQKSSDAARAAHKEAERRRSEKHRNDYQARRDLERFDRNKDGRLDGAEIAERDKYNAEARKRSSEGKKRYLEFMKKYDTNRDGKLSDSEKSAYKAALRQEALKRSALAKEAAKKRVEDARRRRDIERFDKNKDGRLDATESAALNKYREDSKRRMQEYYKKYDSNGDGKITSEEKNAYLQEQKRKKEEHKRELKQRKEGSSKHKKPSKGKPPKSSRKHSRKGR